MNVQAAWLEDRMALERDSEAEECTSMDVADSSTSSQIGHRMSSSSIGQRLSCSDLGSEISDVEIQPNAPGTSRSVAANWVEVEAAASAPTSLGADDAPRGGLSAAIGGAEGDMRI